MAVKFTFIDAFTLNFKELGSKEVGTTTDLTLTLQFPDPVKTTATTMLAFEYSDVI